MARHGWFLARAVAVFTACCSAAQAAPPADPLTLTTEESVPFNMLHQGRIVGLAADKVAEAMRRVQQPYRMDLLPWARAYKMALEMPATCVFATTRTPEREASFKWVGPLAFNTWDFYALASRKLRLTDLADARPYRIGTYNGDARESYLRDRGFELQSVSSDEQNLRKLLGDRIDLWATGVKGRLLLAAQGLGATIVPVLTFNGVELYLACHPSVPTELVDRLNLALAAMAADGTAAAIERRYERWPN